MRDVKKRKTFHAFILILCVILKFIDSQSCNVSCKCTTSGIVTCKQKLTSFPVGLPNNAVLISLSGSPGVQNSIPTLKQSQLNIFPDLKDLQISYSQVTQLEDDVFESTAKLERLYLKNNKITQINANIFQKTRGLFVLDLTGNSGCKISLNAFKSLSKLQSLFLGGLQLETVQTDLFNGLSSLIELDLHGNNLQAVSVDIFKNIPNLRILDLSFNNIALLPDTFLPVFKTLQHLEISDNPWSCICDIEWLRQLNSTAMFSTISGSVPVCMSPYRLKYQPIYHVSDKDLACIPPKILQCGDPYNVKLGDMLQMTCKVEGNMFPNITWVKPDGTTIPVTEIPFSDPSYKTTRNINYPAHAAVVGDDGDWTIRAVNNKGKDVTTIHVHVEVPTTTTTTSTSKPKVEIADISDVGFLIAAGGFGGTVLLGLIVLLSVACCSKHKKNRVKPNSTKHKWEHGERVDEITFVVAPVSG